MEYGHSEAKGSSLQASLPAALPGELGGVGRWGGVCVDTGGGNQGGWVQMGAKGAGSQAHFLCHFGSFLKAICIAAFKAFKMLT